MKIIILFFSIFLSLVIPVLVRSEEPGIDKSINKKIVVDIKNQTLHAYQNDQIVYQTKVSTGLVQTPTPTGSFNIYKKIPIRNMRGYSIVRGPYYLKNVPHVMYFYKGGYAIHGTYWHNNFGQKMSNGCINLSLKDAKWLYNWSTLNTSLLIN